MRVAVFKALTTVLAAPLVVVQAINACLDPTHESYGCNGVLSGVTRSMILQACGITDADHADLEACMAVGGQLQDPPVTVLYMSSNGLTTLPEDVFQSVPNLIELYFGDNVLTSLPEGVFQSLTSLTRLYLYNNQLTTLPEGVFASLTSVDTLSIANNDLTVLPKGIFQSMANLAALVLNSNDLTTLPEGLFESLTSLTYLDISSNTDLECLPTLPGGTSVTGVDTLAANAVCGCELSDGTNPCDQELTCVPGAEGFTCVDEDDIRDDPHMKGLRGQRIDWSGVDGGWYSLVKDNKAELNINVRLTAPLPDEFPDRQLVTGLTVMSEGHSLVIEVETPYAVGTDGCPDGVSPCLANGGLRITVDGQEHDQLLRFSRQVPVVADGAILVSASNLPVECRQFGGDKIWARKYQEFLEGGRKLRANESLEDWILRFDHHMAAPGWCAKYIAENDLADLQSTHAIFKIETPTVTVRLNAGVNHQGDGELDWDGRALPDLEFWQMDVGLDGLDVENPALSGILGETARPVYDENGKEVMEGFEAFRGTVEDYRVSGALGVHFALLD